MSLPSFPSTSPTPVPSSPNVPGPGRGGAGDHLPTSMLVLCGACTFVGECNQAGRAGGNVWALETRRVKLTPSNGAQYRLDRAPAQKLPHARVTALRRAHHGHVSLRRPANPRET